METILLSKIETRDTLQPRATMNFIIVEDYAQAMKDGQIFPPLDVVFDGDIYWLWDGYHRRKAAEQIGLDEINVRVTDGDLGHAEWLALGANKTHGFRRKNEDKRRTVELALRHPKMKGQSLNFLSQHCGVSIGFVHKMNVSFHGEKIESEVTRNGTIYTQNTANIGRKTTAANIPPQVKAQLPLTDIADNPDELTKLDKLPEETQVEVVEMIIEGGADNITEAKNRIDNPDRQMKPKTNQSGDLYEPKGYDACQTPAYAIDPLLPYLSRDWTIWEPAAGENNLVEALYDTGYNTDQVVVSDILEGQNFFEFAPKYWDCLITNPPYSIKYQWLERCYQLGKPFALLVPVEILGAKTAQILLKQYGFEMMLLNKRVDFKMPNKGWDSSAQFPVLWLCWQILPNKVMFGEINKNG
jgi:hypothetical protein